VIVSTADNEQNRADKIAIGVLPSRIIIISALECSLPKSQAPADDGGAPQ